MRYFSTLILFFLLLTGTQQLYAQGAPKPIVGAKLGLNFANIGGESGNKARTAGHLGVYSIVSFDYFLKLQFDFIYSQQGHKSSSGDGGLNLSYINIPMMARYEMSYNLNVHAGLQVGFLLSAKSEFLDEKFDVKDQFKTIDLGLPLGIGWDFMDKKFNANLRYTIGLSNISANAGETRKNNVLQISVGMKLYQVDE